MRFVPHSLLAAVLATGPALAQAPAPGAAAEQPEKQLTAKEQAAIYFQEGRAFFKGKDFRKASERFQAAYNLDPVPILLYNLARASEEMGDPDKAIEHYRFYLKRIGPKAEDRGEVERRIRVMEKTISAARRARVRIAGLPPQARILVDGQPVELEDGLVRAEPGDRTIRIEPRDGLPWMKQLGLATGQYVEIVYGEVDAPPPPPPQPPGMSNRAIAGWTIGGTGVAMGIVGAIFYADASSAVDDYNTASDLLRTTTDEARQNTLARNKDDAEDRARSSGTAAYVMWGLGGAALLGGATLLVLEYTGETETKAAIVPLPGGVGITGSF